MQLPANVRHELGGTARSPESDIAARRRDDQVASSLMAAHSVAPRGKRPRLGDAESALRRASSASAVGAVRQAARASSRLSSGSTSSFPIALAASASERARSRSCCAWPRSCSAQTTAPASTTTSAASPTAALLDETALLGLVGLLCLRELLRCSFSSSLRLSVSSLLLGRVRRPPLEHRLTQNVVEELVAGLVLPCPSLVGRRGDRPQDALGLEVVECRLQGRLPARRRTRTVRWGSARSSCRPRSRDSGTPRPTLPAGRRADPPSPRSGGSTRSARRHPARSSVANRSSVDSFRPLLSHRRSITSWR